jgi:hypothetical protein
MADDLVIHLEASDPVPRFRVLSVSGNPVSLVQVRVTELGSEEPIWQIIQKDGFLAEAVDLHFLTQAEADQAGIRGGPDLAQLACEYGAPVEHVTYGETPEGMRLVGEVGPLVPGKLYQILAVGPGVGLLEFYA